MKDLSQEAQAILDLGASADEPSAADRARVRRAVAARVGMGIAAGAAVGTVATHATANTGAAASASAATSGAATATVTTSAAVGGAGGATGVATSAAAGVAKVAVAGGAKAVLSSVAAKVVLGVALAGAGGAVLVRQTSAPTPTPAVTATVAERAGENAPPIEARPTKGTNVAPNAPVDSIPEVAPVVAPEAVTAAPVAAAPSPAPSPVTARAPESQPAAPSRVTPKGIAEAPAIAPSPPATSALGSIGEETRLIREANVAMQSGHADVALERLAEHERAYPSGVLAEERASQRILALCALGREADAKGFASAFVARYPRSPYLPRLEASCVGLTPRP
ncbi:MAG: hypothetical protein U0235_09235 [Polyangiaceae bacterium]